MKNRVLHSTEFEISRRMVNERSKGYIVLL